MIESVSQLHMEQSNTWCSCCGTPFKRVNSGYCTPCRANYVRDWRNKRKSVTISKKVRKLMMICEELRTI